MISISEHIQRPDADVYLTSLAMKHWHELNKINVTGEYRANSLIAKVGKYLDLSYEASYLHDYAEGDLGKLDRHKTFFAALLEYDNICLEQIIVSKPEELDSIRSEIMQILEEGDLYCVRDGIEEQTSFGRLLSEKIFSYKNFRNSISCINLLRSIGFGSTTCPYCNYNKLDLVPNLGTKAVDDDTVAYLDMDHFFSKARNPFFAISFFNLIPSCHSCNSTDKGVKVFSIESQIHPYFDSFDDYYRFRVSLIAYLGDPANEVFIDAIRNKPNDNSPGHFNLVSKYNNILPEIQSLVARYSKYKKYIGTNEEQMFVELLLGDIPQDRTNILRHATAKIKRDILKQIDITGALKIA
ncbi:hypothetical protein ACHMW6_15085 [Pseudoduganella sp. UC29_106]|uniref:hypothetical protein n=1 Tax=Pseudoduganella sp. UC29_106 TaxID=3374553 RepID=UPI003756D1CC